VEDRSKEASAPKIVVDFAAQKTEAGWQSVWDSFWLRFTPHWFTWIGWATLLGGLGYLWRVTKLTSVLIATVLSGVFILMYFYSFFFRFDFRNVPLVGRHRKASILVSLILCGALSTGAYLLFNGIEKAFSAHEKFVAEQDSVQKCGCSREQHESVQVRHE